MHRFNHHMLSLARDCRGITQSELSRRSKLRQGTLSKYENGILEPSDDVVEQISKILEFPAAFFFQAGKPYGFPPFHFRKRKKLSTKALNRIVAEMNIRRMHISILLRSYEDRVGRLRIPEIDPDDYKSTTDVNNRIEEIAEHIREIWAVPRGPIENMVGLIEDLGAIVIPCDFETDLIDAMSQRVDGLPVLFFVNSTAPADRIRHTLAHELAHMILHTVSLLDDDEMERQADQFAGAFLVPAREFRSQLRRFDLRTLANLKAYWKVSMQSLAMRADKLNLISGYQKKSFWIEMGQLGYRRSEPGEPPHESASTVRRMIDFHRGKLGYSAEEVARLLHLNLNEYQQMYAFAHADQRRAPNLRVVS